MRWCMIALPLALSAVTLAANPLGPGRGPWEVDPPARHGLDAAKLASAWQEFSDHASLGRKCMVVIRDGSLVFEGYARKFTVDTPHDGWSMTKTLGALLAGWATTSGRTHFETPLDIDLNVSHYGVRSPKKYDVTSREIMSQSVAGNSAPGEEWAYDSAGQEWINHMIRVFRKVVHKEPKQIWEKEFAAPLGLSEQFSWNNANLFWAFGSAGTCRDYARIGQLLLNQGKWLRENGEEYEMVDPEYVRQMGVPQTRYAPYTDYSEDSAKYPGVCKVPVDSPIKETSHWPKELGSGNGSAFFAGGANGQITLVLPHLNAVAVTLGDSTDPLDAGNHDYTAACLARTVCKGFGLGACE